MIWVHPTDRRLTSLRLLFPDRADALLADAAGEKVAMAQTPRQY